MHEKNVTVGGRNLERGYNSGDQIVCRSGGVEFLMMGVLKGK